MMTQQTLKFWDSVAKIYDQSELTTHDSNAEIDFIFKKLTEVTSVDRLVCLGVADGCRDPYLLLSFLTRHNKELPLTNIFNDYSPELLKKCKERLDKQFPMLDPVYLPMSVLDIDHEKYCDIKTKNNIIIGCYNFDYLRESLQIYKQQKDVIGNNFKLNYVFFDGTDLLRKDETVSFCIDDYMSVIDKITNHDNDSQFVGCCISTDTGFVTHYYCLRGIAKIIKHVFDNSLNITVTQCGNRYIVSHIVYYQDLCDPANSRFGKAESRYYSVEGVTDNNILMPMQPSNSFTTCLNNVIGNIPTDQQLKALTKMKQLNCQHRRNN